MARKKRKTPAPITAEHYCKLCRFEADDVAVIREHFTVQHLDRFICKRRRPAVKASTPADQNVSQAAAAKDKRKSPVQDVKLRFSSLPPLDPSVFEQFIHRRDQRAIANSNGKQQCPPSTPDNRRHYFCHHCGETFPNTDQLHGHLRRRHATEMTGVNNHPCNCGQFFYNLTGLKNHRNSAKCPLNKTRLILGKDGLFFFGDDRELVEQVLDATYATQEALYGGLHNAKRRKIDVSSAPKTTNSSQVTNRSTDSQQPQVPLCASSSASAAQSQSDEYSAAVVIINTTTSSSPSSSPSRSVSPSTAKNKSTLFSTDDDESDSSPMLNIQPIINTLVSPAHPAANTPTSSHSSSAAVALIDVSQIKIEATSEDESGPPPPSSPKPPAPPLAPPVFSHLLRGTMNQSARKFRKNAGRQCVAISAMVYRVSTIAPLYRWTPEWIDLCLEWGNDYYNEIVEALGGEDGLPDSGHLEIRQLVEESAHFDALLEVKDSRIACLLQPPAEKVDDFVPPKTALEQFFEHYNQGIILANKYARAILKVKPPKMFTADESSPPVRYYLFDSHDIAENGLKSSDGTGKAALMAFDSIESLAEHFNRLVRSTWTGGSDGPLEEMAVELASLDFVFQID